MTLTQIDPGWSWDKPFFYSQAIRAGDLLFVSGQAGVAPDGSVVGPGDFAAQARQAFANLSSVLAAAGAGLRDVIKVTLYVTDMRNFPTVVELRREYFSEPFPADTIVQVQALALPELLFEMDAIAVCPAGRAPR